MAINGVLMWDDDAQAVTGMHGWIDRIIALRHERISRP